ncbi:uncharacterized protein LOC141657128 isoform X1 [Silene latifolia]|uniref:uncharacterized protein LOC141657128 isoform X1 n=2 Tax=Silene latifolia TaxID=37657 RepID=UPI003D76BF19
MKKARNCAGRRMATMIGSLSFSERISIFSQEIAREEKAQVFSIRIDCADHNSIKEAFEGVLSLGSVDVLVYNAAINPFLCIHLVSLKFPSIPLRDRLPFLLLELSNVPNRFFRARWREREGPYSSQDAQLLSVA